MAPSAAATRLQHSPALQHVMQQRALPVISKSSANWAMLSMPEQEAASYLAHPSAADACIHLAAVPPAGAEVEHVRVPVAVEALSLPGTLCSGWAAAQPDGINADLSTRNHMRWLGGSGSLQVSGLLAKVMSAAAAAVKKPATGVSYQVDWQAAVPCSSHPAAAQHTCAWQSGSRRLGMRRSPAGLQRAALGAMAHLRRVQMLLSSRRGDGKLVLATCGGREQGSPGRSYVDLSSAAAWALLKVAAAELDSREWSLGGCSFDPLGNEKRSRHAAPPFTDIHGPAQQHGAWASRRLLPATIHFASLGVCSLFCPSLLGERCKADCLMPPCRRTEACADCRRPGRAGFPGHGLAGWQQQPGADAVEQVWAHSKPPAGGRPAHGEGIAYVCTWEFLPAAENQDSPCAHRHC